MRHNILNAIKVSALALVLSFGLSYVYAWTAPTSNPPAGNVSAPINTSSTAQTKAGSLTISATTTTNWLQVVSGAGVGKVLTSDASGNASWQVAVGGTNQTNIGGDLPEERAYFTPGSYSFVVPSWVGHVWVEAVGGGGGGASGSSGAAGGNGGSSSFGPGGSPLIAGTGGLGGTGIGGAGINGIGNGGSINSRLYGTLSYGTAGSGGLYSYTVSRIVYSRNGSAGGSGGYTRGIVAVTPGQTLTVTVGAGGAGACYLGVYCGTAGGSGYVHLAYAPSPDLLNKQIFTSDGTFTVPAGVTSITVETWGGGGAGTPGVYSVNYDYSYAINTGGGSGGSGGYSRSIFAVTPGQTFPVVVGLGGVGATTPHTITGAYYGLVATLNRGNPGGTSSFGSAGAPATYTYATGGLGGKKADYFCDGYSCNGLRECYNTSAYAAAAGVGAGNYEGLSGSSGAQCDHSNVGKLGGTAVIKNGYSYGAGGNGSSVGGPQYNGGNGAVIVRW